MDAAAKLIRPKYIKENKMSLFGNQSTDPLFSGGDNGMPGSNAPGGQTSDQPPQQPRYQSPQPTQGPSSGGSFTPGGMIPYSSAPNTDLQPGDLSAPGDGLKAKADAFHQQAVSQGLIPVGNGQYHPMNMYTPDQVQAFMNQYQRQAQKLYPSNALFADDSPFLQKHPRAAAVLSSLLLSGSQARAGATLADSIGVASRMALAPGQYAQQQAQDRARYVTGQSGNLLNQQTSLADIAEANQRGKLYDAQSDYYSGAKTDATNAKILTDQQNADTRQQSMQERAANHAANRSQQLEIFKQSDDTKRFLQQLRTSNPAQYARITAETDRNYQSHLASLEQARAKELSDPLNSAQDKAAINQYYDNAKESETDAYNYTRQQARQARQGGLGGSVAPAVAPQPSNTPSSPKAITSNSNTPPASIFKPNETKMLHNSTTGAVEKWWLNPKTNQVQKVS
jgi:hypothetical protein